MRGIFGVQCETIWDGDGRLAIRCHLYILPRGCCARARSVFARTKAQAPANVEKRCEQVETVVLVVLDVRPIYIHHDALYKT